MLSLAERRLLNTLRLRRDLNNRTNGYARVFNARRNYSNLTIYRALEKEGYLTIDSVDNATTENMLYGMSHITYTLKDKNNAT